MKIYSWNVNGLRAVLNKGFIEWVQSENPEIICIQETKIQLSQVDEDLLKGLGYHTYYSFAEKKGYSGVATFTKQKPADVKYGFGIDKFDSEGRILAAEFDGFLLFNIYFPNGQMNDDRLKYKLEFYDAALDYFDNLKSQGKRLVICGDYNTAHREIDIKNAKANEKYSGFLPIERAWMDKLESHGYTDTFRYFYPERVEYSWWSYRFSAREKNVGWRIDYFYISDNMKPLLKDAEIHNEVYGSDHCPIALEINI
jgi:exodeoxyribonuclease III